MDPKFVRSDRYEKKFPVPKDFSIPHSRRLLSGGIRGGGKRTEQRLDWAQSCCQCKRGCFLARRTTACFSEQRSHRQSLARSRWRVIANAHRIFRFGYFGYVLA